MLPAQFRLKNRQLLQTTISRGHRAARRNLVVHYLPDAQAGVEPQPRVAFAVNKAVGGSVVRHRVTRRLRSVVAAEFANLTCGGSVVIRALPPSATATSAELSDELTALLPRVGMS